MTPDEFRKQGHDIIDWIADYWSNVEDMPVLSQETPNRLYNVLPDEAPKNGEDFDQIMEDFENEIMPGITHWQSPNFFAYFP